MIALVFLYIIGFSVLIAGAAAAIEWGVQGRIPTRHLWTVAIAAIVVLPPVTLARRSLTALPPAPTTSASQSAIVEVVQLGRDAGAAMGSRERGTTLHVLRTRFYYALDRIEHVRARTVIELWGVASLALLAWVVTGLAHWRRERLEWEETELDGVSVHLSAETGPAVLGLVTQRIVLPAWARALAPEYRRLMLAHECEHIAARDPQRLALALAALVIMPWNLALWWCAARMRRAIEVDCDARVLRQHPLPREYGYLLLQVAARGTNAGPLAVPLVSLLRLPSELELRLCAMTRPQTIAGRTALAGVAIAGVAVLGAFAAPVPRVARLTSSVLATIRPHPTSVQSRRTRAWVRVRDTVVELDSVTVDPVHDITRGVLPPELRHTPGLRKLTVRDTLPSAKAEDSLQYLARVLAERTHQIDSMRVTLDSMSDEVRLRRTQFQPRGGVVRMDMKHPGTFDETTFASPGPRYNVEKLNVAMNAAFARSATRIDSALKRYYPSLSTDASSNTVIWFLADSAGNVVQNVRKEGMPTSVSAQSAATMFDTVDPKSIETVSIRKWMVGERHLAVAWIELKH